MINNSKFLKEQIIPSPLPLEIKIKEDILNQFAGLTGDFSSLHMDEMFSQKSMFRENVVHGMIPVAFMS